MLRTTILRKLRYCLGDFVTKIKLNEIMPWFEPINMFLFDTDKDCYFGFDERYLDFEIDFEKNLTVLRAKLLKESDSIVRLTWYFDRPDITGYQKRAKSWLEESETRLRRRRTHGIYAGFAVAGTAAAIAASFQANGTAPVFSLMVGWVILSGYLWRHFTRLMRQSRAAVALGRELIELSEKAIKEKDRRLQQESEDERARNTLYLIYQNGIPSMIRSEFYINGEGSPRRKFLPPESADGSLTEFFDQNVALTYQRLNGRADEDFAQKMICATNGIR